MKNPPLQRLLRMWTVLLIVVPSLLIMTIYTVGQIKLAKQENLEQIRQWVDFQERVISSWLVERAATIHELGQQAAFRNLDERQMQNELRLKQQNDPNFDSLSFVDKDGFVRLSTLQNEMSSPATRDKLYYEMALAGSAFISDVVIGRNSDKKIINFSTPIYDYAGNFQGLIIGAVKTTTLEVILKENWIGQTGEILVVNREGTLLTEPRYIDGTSNKGLGVDSAKNRLKISKDVLHNIQLGESGTATWVDYSGNGILGAYKTVPDLDWTLIGKIDEAEVLLPIYKQLVLMAGWTFILFLLILPLASRLIDRIKRPVEWLIEQSILVAQEKYELAVQPNNLGEMPSELKTLCETFVTMSRKIENTVGLLKENEANLEGKVIEIQDINALLEEEIAERQSAQDALQQLNAALEDKVSERTRQLQEINDALKMEIVERQAAQEETLKSRDALVTSEQQLKKNSEKLAATNKALLFLNEELRRISLLDGLTGIANRRYFDEYLEKEWQRAKREKAALTFIMVDIDYFKGYNDAYGHLAGDDCLRMIAGVLNNMPRRSTDIVSRYGGEEFAIILPDTDKQGAAVIGEKVRSCVENLGIKNKASLISENVTVSVGIATFIPEKDALPSIIIASADKALYQAKHEGRNRIRIAEV
ncbi:MAG: diguanylate cyclase/phosphodiesterase [Firmicutes bacterium]|nr:diguanylate cyclase/phosphodiesterase [Bacillota bacterium]